MSILEKRIGEMVCKHIFSILIQTLKIQIKLHTSSYYEGILIDNVPELLHNELKVVGTSLMILMIKSYKHLT